MLNELSGKNILVTGASAGIGRATAIACSRAGARVALVARRVDALNEVLRELSGGGHLVRSFDLADGPGIPAMIRSLSDDLGGLDGVVHAAGAHDMTPIRMLDADETNQLLNLNVTSSAMVVKGFRHKQVRRDGGSVVLMSSAVGVVGQAGVSAYAASKGAIVALSKSLAIELAREKIRVNCLCPGIVETDLTAAIRARIGEGAFSAIRAAHPLGLGTPADVAEAALFLLSDRSRWITGSSISVDGGYTAQ